MKRRTKVFLGLVGIVVILVASTEIALAWSDPASTLSLGLEISANHTVDIGSNLTIQLSLTNALPWPNPGRITGLNFPTLPGGLAFGPFSFFEHVLPVLPGSCSGFPSGYIPAFVAIYNQSGSPQLLNDAPPSITSCPAATSSGLCDCIWFVPFQTKTESISIGGFWHSSNSNEPWFNATYGKFTDGMYSIIAFDVWGQTAKQSFTVIG